MAARLRYSVFVSRLDVYQTEPQSKNCGSEQSNHRQVMKNISIIFLILLFLCGCSGGNVSVKGTVKFDDGSPLTRGTIRFIGDKTQANAVIGAHGTYVLGGAKPGDGIASGVYAVTVSARTGGGSDGRPLVYFVDPKFENASTSGLTCEVKGRRMTHDIIVTKPSEELLRELEQRAAQGFQRPQSPPPPWVIPPEHRQPGQGPPGE
jgi:hypothetical protein